MFCVDMDSSQTPYIVIGEALGAHGQKGELRIKALTEFPERFKPGARLFIEGSAYTVESSSQHRDTAIVKLGGVDTPGAADLLRGKLIEIPESERKELPAGRYYHHDIIGLEVWTTQGVPLGRVSEILTTGGNDVYVVKGDAGELLIPAIKDAVKEIDLHKKRITIEAIEGLLG